MDRIRNFCIIAHIDHGKSTLADRLIEQTGTLTRREMRDQILDSLDLERERGITIKLQAVRMEYVARDGVAYELNLIDTPGHVDFTYEVSRSLAACEGALLVVDATQGVEAQTLANCYLALESDLEIIPVINKIDLPSSDVDSCKRQIGEAVGLDPEGALLISAKTGMGVDALLEAIVRRIPPPKGDPSAPLRALIFDSAYDSYRGVICYVRVKDGSVHAGEKIRMMQGQNDYEVTEVGVFTPKMKAVEALECGDVGYVIAGVKMLSDVRVGDTITSANKPTAAALPGYKEARPVVFAGVYPVRNEDYDELRFAIDKLRLNDAALHVEPETSQALGFGFRCGFLGLLHMEIVQERLEREYAQELLFTAPSVGYRVLTTKGEMLEVDNPAKLPSPNFIDTIEEPYIEARLFFPPSYMGNVLALCQNKKGIQKNMHYITPERVMLSYEFPLSEVITDFHDKLKSVTQGYASLDYEICGYKPGNLVRLDVLVNGEPVDALSVIVHREDAQRRGRQLVIKLRKTISRQLYEVRLQAALGGKIVASESISPMRKNVTAKCYGGDITRKRKLLEKQKEGKKRMKQFGAVEIPQEAFLSVLKLTDEDE
jgi:GTP-binding protein LepA